MKENELIDKIAILQRHVGQYPNNPCMVTSHHDDTFYLEVDNLPKELCDQVVELIGEWSFKEEKKRQLKIEEEIKLLKTQLKELL